MVVAVRGERGGHCIHCHRCLGVKAEYSIHRRGSDYAGGGGHGVGGGGGGSSGLAVVMVGVVGDWSDFGDSGWIL